MDQTRLREIIDHKNEQLESRAVNVAAALIDAIAGEQTKIAASTEKIADLRRELAALEVTQIDPATILG